ncbi:MAG: carbohydrate-binding protein [Peptococcaceae bacterium]
MSFWDGLFNSTFESTPAEAEGINIEPGLPKIGEEVRIRYDGLLTQTGADQIYLHVGYEDNWHDLEDIPMQHYAKGWYCDFVPEYDEINFCFHDSANNWDNNNGSNWNLQINP